MITSPSVESTALAWLCQVPNQDVHQAARALGIPLSTNWYRSLARMQRIAFALGLEVERVPARGSGCVKPLAIASKGEPMSRQGKDLRGREEYSGESLGNISGIFNAPRALLWARVGTRSDRRAVLWGVDATTGKVLVRPHAWSVFDEDAPGIEGVAECTLLGAGMPNGLETVEEMVAWYRQPGCTPLHPCSWLVPRGTSW
jgi:hypothetical protein